MNTFAITFAPFDAKEIPMGTALSYRSAENGHVEIWIRRHKPGPKGGTFVEESLGRVHIDDVRRNLGAVCALMGGHS
jgi:hypothetical protein